MWLKPDLLQRSIIAATLFATGCVPKYADLGPIHPDQIWTPLPVKHVEVDGIDVAYVDSGGNGEPIVFVHGLSSYLSYWEYQLPYFQERGYRVLALDLPGYGQSGRPDAPCTPPWYADLVADWMDVMSAPKAVVVGHSMGGQIAMTLALRHPERVSALVLSAPAGFEVFSPGAASTMKRYWTESRALDTPEVEVRMSFTEAVFNKTDEGVERLIEERVRMGSSPEFRGTSVAVSRSIAGMVDYPVFSRLGEISAPTLILYGTDDRMIPNPIFTGGRTRTIAEAGADAIPGASLVMFEGAGHTVHHDAPDSWNTAVQQFLESDR